MTSRREAARNALGVYATFSLFGAGAAVVAVVAAPVLVLAGQFIGVSWAVDCYTSLRNAKR